MYNNLIKRRLNQLQKCSKKKHSVEFNNSIIGIEGRALHQLNNSASLLPPCWRKAKEKKKNRQTKKNLQVPS